MSFRYFKRLFLFVLLLIISIESFAENYTQKIWEENYPVYQKILNMPFNKEMLNGTLDEKIFRNYIIQDYFYLQNYRKVFGILLAKATDKKSTEFVTELIKGVDEEINEIHTVFFKKFNVTNDELESSVIYPSTEFYNSFLIKTAFLESFEVGLIATLPCHWIYYQLGRDLKNTETVKNNKYNEWIDGYGTISWEESDTKVFVDLINYYMNQSTLENREKMKQVFGIAVKLEYMFWDGVYNNLQWIN